MPAYAYAHQDVSECGSGRHACTFSALGALEQIALNAPQNSGRVRTLQYELRDALKRFAIASNAIATDLQLQAVFAEIVSIIRKPEFASRRRNGELVRIDMF